MWMKNWMKDKRKTIQDYDIVSCQMESGNSIIFVRLTDTDVICASMFIKYVIEIIYLSKPFQMVLHVNL